MVAKTTLVDYFYFLSKLSQKINLDVPKNMKEMQEKTVYSVLTNILSNQTTMQLGGIEISQKPSNPDWIDVELRSQPFAFTKSAPATASHFVLSRVQESLNDLDHFGLIQKFIEGTDQLTIETPNFGTLTIKKQGNETRITQTESGVGFLLFAGESQPKFLKVGSPHQHTLSFDNFFSEIKAALMPF